MSVGVLAWELERLFIRNIYLVYHSMFCTIRISMIAIISLLRNPRIKLLFLSKSPYYPPSDYSNFSIIYTVFYFSSANSIIWLLCKPKQFIFIVTYYQ